MTRLIVLPLPAPGPASSTPVTVTFQSWRDLRSTMDVLLRPPGRVVSRVAG